MLYIVSEFAQNGEMFGKFSFSFRFRSVYETRRDVTTESRDAYRGKTHHV